MNFRAVGLDREEERARYLAEAEAMFNRLPGGPGAVFHHAQVGRMCRCGCCFVCGCNEFLAKRHAAEAKAAREKLLGDLRSPRTVETGLDD